MKILFILKKNECYGFSTYTRRSAGLWNSTSFIIRGLKKRGINAKIVEVIDNNCIDREVSEFRPDVVVIEALWVVPEKFDELIPLHPEVKWYVHMHSDIPFLAMEGIAMNWLIEYAARGVGVIANSKESYAAFSSILGDDELVYLPNVYIGEFRAPLGAGKPLSLDPDVINVGSFGALRPLKNQLLQALAAIQFAKEQGKKLRFHVNSSRVETGGDPVLRNLVELFEKTPDAELIQCPWMEHDEFVDFLWHWMDIGMQVSLTETFNVVAADYCTAGIPMVVSNEVKWASRLNWAKDNSIADIVSKMHRAYKNKWLVRLNQWLLEQNARRAQKMWADFCWGIDG